MRVRPHVARNALSEVIGKGVFVGLFAVALAMPGSAAAKGFTGTVLVGSDCRSVEIHANEAVIHCILTSGGSFEHISGGDGRLSLSRPARLPTTPTRYEPQ